MAPVETRPGRIGVDSAGRYVVAGVRYDNTQGTACDARTDDWSRVGDQHVVIARYLADGTADASFGDGGSLVVPQSTHTVDLTDLVISGSDIYVSAYRQTAVCAETPGSSASEPAAQGPSRPRSAIGSVAEGALRIGSDAERAASSHARPVDAGRVGASGTPGTPPSIVVKVNGNGALDRSFGSGGIWEARQTSEEVHLGALGNGEVGAFFDSTFAYLSDGGVRETDLQSTLCSGREVVGPGDPSRDCPRGARLVADGSTVALTLAWGRQDNRSMRVFFGELHGSAIAPDTKVSETGIAVVDLSTAIGDRTVWPGTNWIGWDSQGRLLSMVTVTEPFPELVNPGSPQASIMDTPHGRGLAVARFIPDSRKGWVLDESYGQGGLAYVALPVSGPDSFEIGAFGLDSDDRPVLVGQWWNFTADTGGQFALRLTPAGSLDGTYGAGGLTWLPYETPLILGRPALDIKDDQYFASAWGDFASRSRTKAPYQLGRLTNGGRVQVHDGHAWRTARQQAKPRLQLTLDAALPKSTSATEAIPVTAHVSIPVPHRRATIPVKGVVVTVSLIGAGGWSDKTVIASARTDERGVARLSVLPPSTGYYCVSAQGKKYVATGGGVTRVQVL